MKVHITKNYIDEDGRGHYNETLEVPDWKGRQLINDGQAVDADEWETKQAVDAKQRAESEAFDAERRATMGLKPIAPAKKASSSATAKNGGTTHV